MRAYYVTVLVGRDENPETHANPATTRRVYDRRRVVKIKGSARRMPPWSDLATFRKRKKALRFSRKCLISFEFFGVADGTRTHDNRNHNPGLYQLSYSHHLICFAVDTTSFVLNCKEAEF